MNAFSTEKRQSCISSKLLFFLFSICGTMTRISSRITPLWRNNGVICDEIRLSYDWDGVFTSNHRILCRKLLSNLYYSFPEFSCVETHSRNFPEGKAIQLSFVLHTPAPYGDFVITNQCQFRTVSTWITCGPCDIYWCVFYWNWKLTRQV